MFAIDGTNKAYNSKHNVITEKETEILLDYLSGANTNEEELNKLHKAGEKILNNKTLSNNDKIDLLYDIMNTITFSGKDISAKRIF